MTHQKLVFLSLGLLSYIMHKAKLYYVYKLERPKGIWSIDDIVPENWTLLLWFIVIYGMFKNTFKHL